jgi:hypothetical protein
MNDQMIHRMKKMDRTHFHRLWLKSKHNDTDDITPEDKQLIKIMLKHEDQYGEIFGNPDLPITDQVDGDSRNNPFLHITIHSILETQLKSKEPIEAYQFILSMRNRGCTHHEALHLVEVVLVCLFCTAVQEGIPFDMERYKFLLRKYKKRKPQKIYDLLAQEFKGIKR